MTNLSNLKLRRKWRCERCGECCRNLFGKRFGAAVSRREKQRLEILAKKHGVTLHLEQLAVSSTGAQTLFQFTTHICPFLDKSRNSCKIYDHRPFLCRAYPLMPYGVGECTALRHMKDHFEIVLPASQLQMGQEYLVKIAPLFKSAAKFYNMNTGTWSINPHGI